MFTKEPMSFHDASKPIIYFNWLMGMGVEWQLNLSDVQHFCMKLYTITFIPLNWTMHYIGLNALQEASKLPVAPLPKTLHMYKALLCINCCIAVMSPLLIRFQRKAMRDCLRRMPILNAKFQAILGVENEYRKRYISQIYQVITILLIISLMSVGELQWIVLLQRSLLENFAIEFMLMYPLIVLIMLDLNFCISVRYLHKKFKDLNYGILRLADKSPAFHPGKKIFIIPRKVFKKRAGLQMKDTRAKNSVNCNHYLLRQTRELHLDLCNLSRQINHAFGIQNLVSMSTSFVIVTGVLYTIYGSVLQDGLTTNRLKEVVTSISWAILYALRIWMVNHSCWSASSEALVTRGVIYELLQSSVDMEFRNEIQEFGLQMLQNPVHFNARGFFPLDYTFVQGIIGSITTYLVILIQMNYMSANSESDTTSA